MSKGTVSIMSLSFGFIFFLLNAGLLKELCCESESESWLCLLFFIPCVVTVRFISWIDLSILVLISLIWLSSEPGNIFLTLRHQLLCLLTFCSTWLASCNCSRIVFIYSSSSAFNFSKFVSSFYNVTTVKLSWAISSLYSDPLLERSITVETMSKISILK